MPKLVFLLVLYIPFVKYACILRWPIKNHVIENLNPRPKTSVKVLIMHNQAQNTYQ